MSEARCVEESVALGRVSGQCGGLKARDIVPTLSLDFSPQTPLPIIFRRATLKGKLRCDLKEPW
jgi:hypothetical protein